ncbi:unnamed protein product [Lota lota]
MNPADLDQLKTILDVHGATLGGHQSQLESISKTVEAIAASVTDLADTIYVAFYSEMRKFFDRSKQGIKDQLIPCDLPTSFDGLVDVAICVDTWLSQQRRLRTSFNTQRADSGTFLSPLALTMGARGPAPPTQPEPMLIDWTHLSYAERKRRMDSKACLYCEESFIDATLATKWGVPVSILQTPLTASALNGSSFASVKHLTVPELESSAPSVQAFIRRCRATWRRARTTLLHSGAQGYDPIAWAQTQKDSRVRDGNEKSSEVETGMLLVERGRTTVVVERAHSETPPAALRRSSHEGAELFGKDGYAAGALV